jgi:hypothetical protein
MRPRTLNQWLALLDAHLQAHVDRRRDRDHVSPEECLRPVERPSPGETVRHYSAGWPIWRAEGPDRELIFRLEHPAGYPA